MPDADCVPLKDHLLAVMDERDAARDKALELANDNLEVRLEAMNEFRAQIQAERGDYMTRALYGADLKVLEIRLGSLERSRAWLAGAVAVLMLVAGGLGWKIVGG